MRQDCSCLSQAEVDDAAWWLERRQSSRYTGSAMLYCQLWTNQIILVQSHKNLTHPTCSPLSSEHLRTVLKTETTLTNCAHQRCFQRWLIVYFPSVIPKTSLDIYFIFFGWAERSSLAITSCLVNKLSSKTASCQELWSRGVLTTPCSLDKRSLAL